MLEVGLQHHHFDLATPDGKITHIAPLDKSKKKASLLIEKISPVFVGYQIESSNVHFNIKCTLAQLGINGVLKELVFEQKLHLAHLEIELEAIGELACILLDLLEIGAYVGKLFAADERRRVREPEYLLRMFSRSDRKGRPLLSLGGLQGNDLLSLEKTEGRAVAYLALQEGAIGYEPTAASFLPTLAKALHHSHFSVRSWLHLHQKWIPHAPRNVEKDQILLVRTLPLHIRTVFGKVAVELLPKGFHHTTASVLQPDTMESGDIYELFGSSEKAIGHIPLEFYTLEPFREYVFFRDRDQLQDTLENSAALFKVFETAPLPLHNRAATFIVKSDQLLSLTPEDWINRVNTRHELPGFIHPHRQSLLVQRYIEQQPTYPLLKAIEDEIITSQGVLFTRYFPSPLMKRDFLNDRVKRCLKALYFQYPSLSHNQFFSHEDRSFLLDLAKFAIPVFWVDEISSRILQYVPKPDKDSGLFVPLQYVNTFLKSTVFGIYGSCLIEGSFERELTQLMEGILTIQASTHHPLLNSNTPIALITGGGPGVMEVGNRVAQKLGILSCANFVDFRRPNEPTPTEQRQNSYVDAKMTYRIDRLIERQAEFNLDFPIFLEGGIGTDFEFSLEELRRKVRSTAPSPILLFGPHQYWKQKITDRFQCNLTAGTIAGSEWVSNCLFCIQNASQGLKIYDKFFNNLLPIGPTAPYNKEGFMRVS